MHKLLWLKLEVIKMKLEHAKTDSEKKPLMAELDKIHKMIDEHIANWSSKSHSHH